MAQTQQKQIFFQQPEVDRVVGMVMELAAELHVMKDRMRVLEKMLESKGQISREAIDGWQPDEADSRESAEERDGFIGRLLQDVAANPA